MVAEASLSLQPYYEDEVVTLYNADALDVLRRMESASVDSLVTDPPAGIGFMGRSWDSDKGGRLSWIQWLAEIMSEARRVLKPGAHGLVWALPRTSHWTATALEEAGFEVRDVITHHYATGFPKSHDISKATDKLSGAEREVVGESKGAGMSARQPEGAGTFRDDNWTPAGPDLPVTAPATEEAQQYDGWGTALKPASEHWILVRKPLSESSVAKNVLKHGTGGINIDGSRVSNAGYTTGGKNRTVAFAPNGLDEHKHERCDGSKGRFPANLILSPGAAEEMDRQSGYTVSQGGNHSGRKGTRDTVGRYGYDRQEIDRPTDSGGASRFFFIAKPSKAERAQDNPHPTTKPITLMRYLARLITPPDGTVLDPFAGSGTTAVAAAQEGFKAILVESEAEYAQIAKRRVEQATAQPLLPLESA